MNDDSAFSKNKGEHIKYRKRLIEDKEARMAREDALKHIAEDEENERRNAPVLPKRLY
jgi:hypothetical protein